jgi:hypothetical protein
MFIPDPDFYPSRIPDLGSRIQKQQWKTLVKKNLSSYLFFGVINFTKFTFFLKCWRKKFGPIFKELYNFLPKKLSLSSQKYGFGIRDPGSRKTYPGSRIQGSKRHRIPDPRSGSATLIFPCLLVPNGWWCAATCVAACCGESTTWTRCRGGGWSGTTASSQTTPPQTPGTWSSSHLVSVPDPWQFCVDPDPRILLFSSLTFKILKKVYLLITFWRNICIIFQR